MLPLFGFAAAAALTTPTEPLRRQLYSSIWYDLGVNALIGNGNWVASLWYNARGDDLRKPELNIQQLACQNHKKGHRCTFILFRDGGVKTVFGEEAPDRLSCEATFIRAKDGQGWAVKHVSVRGAGHTQTTMKCVSAPV